MLEYSSKTTLPADIDGYNRSWKTRSMFISCNNEELVIPISLQPGYGHTMMVGSDVDILLIKKIYF